jgi:hypothetical protein
MKIVRGPQTPKVWDAGRKFSSPSPDPSLDDVFQRISGRTKIKGEITYVFLFDPSDPLSKRKGDG